MKDLERERAAHALAKVKALLDRPEEFRKSYRAYVDRFGGAVVMNGLGQALATELAAAGPSPTTDGDLAHKALADNVCEWLSREGGVYAGEPDAVGALMEGDQALYLRAQAEVLAWLTWHKKFCHAYLPRGGDE